ncbi:MAG: hypothetical protein ACM3XP_04930 [Nitrososphaerales archaeon]
MYPDKLIDDLNEYGILSISYLARKYKMNFEHALRVLIEIVEDYENVEFKTSTRIYINDREPGICQSKISKYRRMRRL